MRLYVPLVTYKNMGCAFTMPWPAHNLATSCWWAALTPRMTLSAVPWTPAIVAAVCVAATALVLHQDATRTTAPFVVANDPESDEEAEQEEEEEIEYFLYDTSSMDSTITFSSSPTLAPEDADEVFLTLMAMP